ncbi:MAG TPA: thermonuclease family protein, partial [Pseudolysinimonas sp.]
GADRRGRHRGLVVASLRRDPARPERRTGGQRALPHPRRGDSCAGQVRPDGDTLFLTDSTKVRLLGIDTPEVGENLECYGNEATDELRSLVPDGSRVMILADVQPLDQYGRSLLFVYAEDGKLVNLELIEDGMAEAVVLPPNVLFADELEAAEDHAQAAGAGMWGAC